MTTLSPEVQTTLAHYHQSISDEIERVRQIEDPVERFHQARQLQVSLAEHRIRFANQRAVAIAEMAETMTLREIAHKLGVSVPRASQLVQKGRALSRPDPGSAAPG